MGSTSTTANKWVKPDDLASFSTEIRTAKLSLREKSRNKGKYTSSKYKTVIEKSLLINLTSVILYFSHDSSGICNVKSQTPGS